MGSCPCLTKTLKIPHSDLFIPKFDVTLNQIHQKKLLRLRSLKSRHKKQTKSFKEMSTEKYIRAKALFRNTVKSTGTNLMSLNSIEAKKKPGYISALTGDNESKNGKLPHKSATGQYIEPEDLSPVSFHLYCKGNNLFNNNNNSFSKGNNGINSNISNINNCSGETSCVSNIQNKTSNQTFKNNNNNLQQGLIIPNNNMYTRLTTKQSNFDLSHLKNIECDISEQLFSSNEELFIADVLLRHYLFHRATDDILNYLFSEISEFQIEEDAPIFYEGDEGTCMFMIKKGQVELTQKDCNQKFILTDGEVFGEAGLIREGNRRTYTARSISYLEFYIIDINAYKEVANKLIKPTEFVFDLFEYFDEPYKSNINLLCAENDFKKGTTINDLNGVFAIESGNISLTDKHGKEILKYKPGDIYGVHNILMDDNNGTSLRRDTTNGAENKLSVGEDCKCFIVTYIAFIEIFGINYQEQIRKMVYVNMIKKNVYLNSFLSKCDINNIFNLFTVQEYKRNEIIQNINEEKLDDNKKKIKLIVNGHFSSVIQNPNAKKVSSIGKIIGENYLSGKPIKSDYYVDSPKVVCLECKWNTLKENIPITHLNMNLCALIDILKNFHFFYGARESTLLKYAYDFKEATFKDNEIIIPSNKVNDKIYFISNGKAALIDQKVKVKIYTEGNTLGYLSAFVNSEIKWEIISITNDTHCYYLDKEVFYNLISDSYLNAKLRKMICLSNREIFPNSLYYLNTIHKGTNSRIYLVHNKHCLYTVKSVFIEKLNKTRTSDLIVVKILQEKKAIKYINHPFLVTYVKTLKSKRWIFFIEEYINGITLQKYIEMYRPLNDISITKFYAACLFIILDTLHLSSLIHRDIKPQNLIMESNGYIRLIDFSSCIKIKKSQPAKTIIGTPLFIAPEVIIGKGYNYKCDYWSVGIILYLLYYGEYPFGGKANSPELVYKEILNKKLSFVNTDNPNKELEMLLCGLLKKKEKKRIGNIQSVYQMELFKEFKWELLKRMEMDSPCIPQIDNINKDLLLKNYTQPFYDFIFNEKVTKNTACAKLDRDLIASIGDFQASSIKDNKSKEERWFDIF